MQKYWIHFHCGTFTLWLFDSHGSERIRQHYEIYYIVEWIPRQGDARKYTIYASGASIFNSWLLVGNMRLNSRLLIFYFSFALHFFTNLFHFSCVFFSRVFAIFTRECILLSLHFAIILVPWYSPVRMHAFEMFSILYTNAMDL